MGTSKYTALIVGIQLEEDPWLIKHTEDSYWCEHSDVAYTNTKFCPECGKKQPKKREVGTLDHSKIPQTFLNTVPGLKEASRFHDVFDDIIVRLEGVPLEFLMIPSCSEYRYFLGKRILEIKDESFAFPIGELKRDLQEVAEILPRMGFGATCQLHVVVDYH